MSLFVSLGIGLIQILVSIYDLLTIFIYFLLQRPWVNQKRKDEVRAKKVLDDGASVTYRAVPIKCKVKDKLKADKSVTTMASLFNYCVKLHGNRKCLGTREIFGENDEVQPNGKIFKKLTLGGYSWESYTDVNIRAQHLGRGLRSIGVQPHEKIVVYANTCADWMTTSIACFQHSISIVTIYTNLGEEGVSHGITQTSSKVVVASEELIPRLIAVLPSAPFVNTVIIIPSHNPQPKPQVPNVMFYTIDDVALLGKEASKFEEYPPQPEDTAIIMYTSGSTGVPKGVVLTHNNILQALYSLLPTTSEALGVPTETSAYMAYLPLAHILELLAENLMIVLGIPIGYGTTNTLLDTSSMVSKGSNGDVTELRPTVMCAVPLVLDRIFKGLQAGVKQRGLFLAQLVDYCYRYRLSWTRRGYGTPIMDRLIFKNLRAIVGGNLEVLLSGGAPLAPDAHEYCRTVLGITLLQGYGLTETAATATIPDKYDFSTGLVGPPLQDVDIRIINWEEGGYKINDQVGPRGEVIIGGQHVAKEYYNLPDKTEEEFFNDQGKRWFRTGDIGHIQSNGTLKIIDRKKDLVKLQGGEYVSLGKVESILKIHPLVDNVCIYADPSRSNTVALLVPDQPALENLAKKMNRSGMNRDQLCADSAVRDSILKSLQQHGASQKLAKFEIPQAIFLVSEFWTPESGLVTAAMKLKRKSIESAFKDEITDMYNTGGPKPKPKAAPANPEPSPAGNTPEPNNNTPLPNENIINIPESLANNDGNSTNDNNKVEIKSPSIENSRSESASPQETRPTSPESTEAIEIVDIEAGRSEIAKLSKVEKVLGVPSKEAFVADTSVVNEEKDDIETVTILNEKSVDKIILMGTEIVADNVPDQLNPSTPQITEKQ